MSLDKLMLIFVRSMLDKVRKRKTRKRMGKPRKRKNEKQRNCECDEETEVVTGKHKPKLKSL